MKHLKLFEGYLDFIDDGSFNKVLDLDDKDWLLKMPLSKDEGNFNKSTKEILGDFRRHILFMNKYPEFFVKVKKLDRYRALVEKVDIKKAEEEIDHITNVLYKDLFGAIEPIKILYTDSKGLKPKETTKELERLKEYATLKNDPICLKWYIFVKKLRSKFFPIDLDLHSGNIGLDKEGNIKLVDF